MTSIGTISVLTQRIYIGIQHCLTNPCRKLIRLNLPGFSHINRLTDMRLVNPSSYKISELKYKSGNAYTMFSDRQEIKHWWLQPALLEGWARGSLLRSVLLSQTPSSPAQTSFLTPFCQKNSKKFWIRLMLLTSSIGKEEFEWLKSTWKVNNRFLEDTDRESRKKAYTEGV